MSPKVELNLNLSSIFPHSDKASYFLLGAVLTESCKNRWQKPKQKNKWIYYINKNKILCKFVVPNPFPSWVL